MGIRLLLGSFPNLILVLSPAHLVTDTGLIRLGGDRIEGQSWSVQFKSTWVGTTFQPKWEVCSLHLDKEDLWFSVIHCPQVHFILVSGFFCWEISRLESIVERLMLFLLKNQITVEEWIYFRLIISYYSYLCVQFLNKILYKCIFKKWVNYIACALSCPLRSFLECMDHREHL